MSSSVKELEERVKTLELFREQQSQQLLELLQRLQQAEERMGQMAERMKGFHWRGGLRK